MHDYCYNNGKSMSVLKQHWQVNGCTVITLVSQCLFCYNTGKSTFIAMATYSSDRPSLIGCHSNRKVFITDFPLNNHERCEVGTERTCLKQVLKLELNTFLYNMNLYIHVNKIYDSLDTPASFSIDNGKSGSSHL